MGGGNGQKSHMAREKKQAKEALKGVGGGGKDGIKARNESAVGTSCALCRTPFTSVKMKTQLKDHWEGNLSLTRSLFLLVLYNIMSQSDPYLIYLFMHTQRSTVETLLPNVSRE
jgi:hypothetical protein